MRTPLVATVVNGAVWITLTAILLRPLGIAAVGISWMVASWTEAVLFARALWRAGVAVSRMIHGARCRSGRVRAPGARRADAAVEPPRPGDRERDRCGRRIPCAQLRVQPCRSGRHGSTSEVAHVNAERPNAASAGVEAPFFLVGSERSGTTLLRLMLDHHPEIAFEKEFDFVVTTGLGRRRVPVAARLHRVDRHRSRGELCDRPVARLPGARERLPPSEAGRLRRQASRRRDDASELRPAPVPVAGRSIHPPRPRSAGRGPLSAAERLGGEHLPGVRVLDSSRELLGFTRHAFEERSGDRDALRGSGDANRSDPHRDLPVRGCRLLGEDARVPSRCAAVSTTRSQPGRAVEDEALAAERRAGGASDSFA